MFLESCYESLLRRYVYDSNTLSYKLGFSKEVRISRENFFRKSSNDYKKLENNNNALSRSRRNINLNKDYESTTFDNKRLRISIPPQKNRIKKFETSYFDRHSLTRKVYFLFFD